VIIAVTGHRPHKLGEEWDMKGPVSGAVRAELRRLLERRRPERAISGMALGVDMIFAQEVLALGIPLTAAIPFEGQEARWSPGQQIVYRKLLEHPLVEQVVCAAGGPEHANHKYHNRNRWLVDHSDVLVAVWDGSAGGTRHCYLYAREIGRPIVRVRPLDVARLRWIVEDVRGIEGNTPSPEQELA
jgi:uncharacterized phage-like protein YoqJ